MDSFSMTSNVLELIAKFESVRAGMQGAGEAMRQSVAEHILEVLPTNMTFMNPTGALESSFFFDGTSVTSDLPYARRREFGFSGMTDSLGRFYPNDPGIFYLGTTLQQVTTDGSINASFVSFMSGVTGGGE